MNVNTFRRLFDYNYWAHKRVWDCVLELSEAQYTQPSDYSMGSVYEQVVHTMGVEWLWLERMRGISLDEIPQPSLYPTRDAVRAQWDKVEASWRAYIDKLTDAQLNDTVVYISIKGHAQRTSVIWEALAHVLNHGTDHRAQTLALIHQRGGRTVEQDLVLYSWEKGSDRPVL